MRIVLLTDSYHPSVDGMVFVVDTAKKALEKRGHEVHIVAPDPGEEHRIEGVHYFRSIDFSTYNGYYVPVYPSNKIEVIQKINPDVIHSHGLTLMALKGFIAAHTLKIPFITTMGTMVTDVLQYYLPIKLPLGPARKLSWTYLKMLLEHSDAVVNFTSPIREELEAQGIEARRWAVITAGVDTDIFYPMGEPEGLREEMGLVGKRVIMCVGRLSFEKHVEEVVQGLKYLPEDIHLIIDGDGPAREFIEEIVEEENQKERVHFIGMVEREELPKYYTMVDLCVSASRFETQGLSLMEAMACRVPIVVPAVRAFKEIVNDGVNGFLYDGDIQDMAKRILEAFDAVDETIRDNAKARAEFYSVDSSTQKMEDLYLQVIEDKKQRLSEKKKKK